MGLLGSQALIDYRNFDESLKVYTSSITNYQTICYKMVILVFRFKICRECNKSIWFLMMEVWGLVLLGDLMFKVLELWISNLLILFLKTLVENWIKKILLGMISNILLNLVIEETLVIFLFFVTTLVIFQIW